MDDTFFQQFLPVQTEAEQKYIASIFDDLNRIHLVPYECLFDETCKKIHKSITEVLGDGLIVDIETVADYAKGYGIELKDIQNICNCYSDFDNIAKHTAIDLKHYATQRKITEKLDQLSNQLLDSGNTDKTSLFKGIKELSQDIIDGSFEFQNDDDTMSTKDMSDHYRTVQMKRKNPQTIRTYGFERIDRLVTRKAEPEESTIIIGRKGSGKSTFLKAIENNLMNRHVCVISLGLEPALEATEDILFSMRSGISVDDLMRPDKDPSLEVKIERHLRMFETYKNYKYYRKPSINLADLEDLIATQKRKFKSDGVLPEDGYVVVTLDLQSQVDEFSGADYKQLQKAVNKFTVINKRQYCHIIGLLQAKEGELRGKKFTKPDQCDYYTITMEDVFGGSDYAARARVMFALNRPVLLKHQFFPSRDDEWNLETDILWFNLIKENAGKGKLGRTPFVFPDDSSRIGEYNFPTPCGATN
jgi:energy-coupling factor transporter ATP-binding protein EcfA2